MKQFLFFLVIAIFFSCNKKQEVVKEKEEYKPLLSVVNEYSSIKKIRLVYKKDVEGWEELEAVNKFLSRFKKVSPNEVLSNAEELKGLVESLKDSVKPELFENPSFNARINIFYNETLRLVDMTTIPAIKADEVNKQVEKVIAALSTVNTKVNTVLSKKRFEDAIKIDVKFIGLDSTKIDSVSKNSINKKLEERKASREKLRRINKR